MIKQSYLIHRPGDFTPGQSEPENNSNEEGLHILEISKAGASSLDGLMSCLEHLFGEGWVLLLCRDALDVFYNPSWLGYKCRTRKTEFTLLPKCGCEPHLDTNPRKTHIGWMLSHTHLDRYAWVYIYSNVFILTHLCVYVCFCFSLSLHIYIYIYIYIYI